MPDLQAGVVVVVVVWVAVVVAVVVEVVILVRFAIEETLVNVLVPEVEKCLADVDVEPVVPLVCIGMDVTIPAEGVHVFEFRDGQVLFSE